MNIILLDPGESGTVIPKADRRWAHVHRVLRKGPGDTLAAGCSDGSLGTALIKARDEAGLVLEYRPEREAPGLLPIRMVIGFPRPIQAGRLLKDLTSIGVASIWFCLTELGEKSYARSDFFAEAEYGRHLREGAEQAGNPRLPEVRTFWSLRRALDALDAPDAFDGFGAPRATVAPDEPGSPGAGGAPTGGGKAPAAGSRILFHPDGDARRVSELAPLDPPLTLAVGNERGWTDPEVAQLRGRGFAAAALGARILKTETACIASATLALAALGIM